MNLIQKMHLPGKAVNPFILLTCLCIILPPACVREFFPETTGNKYLLVVNGMINNQDESYRIKLSRTQPLSGVRFKMLPVRYATVKVTDDNDNSYYFYEHDPGIYFSDPGFRGEVGRKYSLYIMTYDSLGPRYEYRSVPVEMIPVPEIDSIYYEKLLIQPSPYLSDQIENCQIYLDTHDESGRCKYYRWDYSETWEFHLHWPGEKPVCWLTENSDNINIKSTSGLSIDLIRRFPLKYIDQSSDRLEVRYSIFANQYSLSEDEFSYWEKLKQVTQNVGGLYDLIPSNIPSNIVCETDPSQQVEGYFSVSAKSSKRIFIREHFAGQINFYQNCASNKIINPGVLPGIGHYVWILERNDFAQPPYIIVTSDKGCVDCTMRGTDVKPSFWDNQ